MARPESSACLRRTDTRRPELCPGAFAARLPASQAGQGCNPLAAVSNAVAFLADDWVLSRVTQAVTELVAP